MHKVIRTRRESFLRRYSRSSSAPTPCLTARQVPAGARPNTITIDVLEQVVVTVMLATRWVRANWTAISNWGSRFEGLALG